MKFLYYFFIIISLSSLPLYGQNKQAEQYFFNKAFDLIIENASFSVINVKIFIKNDKLDTKLFLNRFKDKIPENLKLDTTQFLKFIHNYQCFNQYELIVVDNELAEAINFSKLFFFKIIFNNPIKFIHEEKEGYMLFFNTEYSDELNFSFDNLGLVIGWIDKYGYFESLLYYDGIYKNEPYVPLIKID